jgi:hypothetical protein
MSLSRRATRFILTSVGIALFVAGAARGGVLSVSAGSASPTQVLVQWTFTETPGYPAGRPEWVGYDVWRRSVADCGDWVLLNPDVIPRVVGLTHSGSFLDTPPVTSATWRYDVRTVDASRVRVPMGLPDCEPPCPPPAYAACPDLSAPMVVGSVTGDMGWAVMLSPCPSGCWGTFYVPEPAATALRVYFNTGQTLVVFGTPYCGTVEGCGLALDRFQPGACGATPVRRTSWGRLKSVYR